MSELTVNGEKIYNEELIKKIENHKYQIDNLTMNDKVYLLLNEFFRDSEETEREKYERLKYKYEYNCGAEA